jgi:hypothetical protein
MVEVPGAIPIRHPYLLKKRRGSDVSGRYGESTDFSGTLGAATDGALASHREIREPEGAGVAHGLNVNAPTEAGACANRRRWALGVGFMALAAGKRRR